MQMLLEGPKEGWVNVDVMLSPDEINELISLLEMIRDDPDQHFHLNSDFQGPGGVGQITFSQSEPGDEGNSTLSGRAYLPGESI